MFVDIPTKCGEINQVDTPRVLEVPRGVPDRVTVPLVQNLRLTLMSTGGFEQVEWSPCICMKCPMECLSPVRKSSQVQCNPSQGFAKLCMHSN